MALLSICCIGQGFIDQNVADLPNEFLKSYLRREHDKEVTSSEVDATSSSPSFLLMAVDKGR